MSAIISEKFRIFNAKQFLESIGSEDANGTITGDRNKMYFFVGRPQRWNAYLEIYNKGTVAMTVGREVYVSLAPDGLTSYTYGTTPFRATVEAVFDNSVVLSSVFPSVTSAPLAGSTIQEYDGSAAVAGATAITATYRYATEDVPPVPLDNQEEMSLIYDDIIAAKRITPTFVRSVVARGGADWSVTTNRLFDMYRPDYAATPYASNGVTPSGGIGKSSATGATTLSNAKFFVMNRDYEVFKCLYNGEDPDNVNGQNATYEPKTQPSAGEGVYSNGVYTEPAGTAGYRWKFLYKIPTNDVLRFLSSDFIPLAPYTGTTPVDGAIDTVIIKDRGANLPNGTHYARVKGDGTTDAVVEIIVTGGEITGARIPTDLIGTAEGAGYTFGTVPLITGNSAGNAGLFSDTSLSTPVTVSGATGEIEVIIPPPGGHGADLEAELIAKRVMCNIRLTYAEGSGDFPVDNDFRRIGIVRDPDNALTGSPATDETLNGLYAVKIASQGGVDYAPDETITQTNGSQVSYGTVVSWTLDSGSTTSGVLKYIQTPALHKDADGVVYPFQSGAATVDGANSLAQGTIDTTENGSLVGVSFTAGIATPEIKNNSGDLIYIENRRLITRAADQIEDIKLVIEF